MHEHSQLQVDKLVDREIYFISEKLFTVALLGTHKMIWYTRQEHGNQTAQHQFQPSCAHASHFQKVSVAMSKLGYNDFIFSQNNA